MTQSEALDILKLGYNVFLTGAAGSGKTYVLNQFIHYLRSHKIGVGITASTGIAATHLHGMTIHSWAGIGIHDYLSQSQLESLLEKSQLAKRFNDTKVLIIDEVSMLHGLRLDLVDQVCRAFKDAERPFGGLQVVLCGDLFQLPPISRGSDAVDWVFMSQAWQNMDLKVCYLSEQHRQDDNDLLDILNAVRSGEVEEYHFTTLQERFTPAQKDGITRLYTHNENVDIVNRSSLEKIDEPTKLSYMTSTGNKKLVESLKLSCLAPEELVLKVGAEVMFVVNNQQEKYVNGTRGKVVDFTSDNLPVVETTDGRVITPNVHTWNIIDGDKIRASISQLPLRLAWAITIHKSQGMTLDEAEVDLSRAFEPGMGYVAISRVRTLDGLYILGANNVALGVSPVILELDAQLRRESKRLQAGLAALGEEKVATYQRHVLSRLAPQVDVESYDETLFDELRAWRAEVAKEQSLPAYMVLADKTLKGIAALKPRDEQELKTVSGIGPQKLERYGADILKLTTT